MFPFLNIFGAEFSTYTLCTVVGILLSGLYVCRTAKKLGHDDNDYIIFMLVCSIGVIVGGHLLYGITKIPVIVELLTNWSKYISGFGDFAYALGIIFGGAVFYGGLIGGIVAGWIYGKHKKFDMYEFSDICAPMVPLFHGFGRIGCFLGGCCYGIESDFGFTVEHNDLIPSLCGVNRFPVQLMEALLNFGLFFLLAYLLKKDKLKGRLFATYLFIYSIIRFCDEFLRGDSYRGFLFGLSTSQIISILLFIGSVTYLIVFNVKKKTSRDGS